MPEMFQVSMLTLPKTGSGLRDVEAMHARSTAGQIAEAAQTSRYKAASAPPHELRPVHLRRLRSPIRRRLQHPLESLRVRVDVEPAQEQRVKPADSVHARVQRLVALALEVLPFIDHAARAVAAHQRFRGEHPVPIERTSYREVALARALGDREAAQEPRLGFIDRHQKQRELVAVVYRLTRPDGFPPARVESLHGVHAPRKFVLGEAQHFRGFVAAIDARGADPQRQAALVAEFPRQERIELLPEMRSTGVAVERHIRDAPALEAARPADNLTL